MTACGTRQEGGSPSSSFTNGMADGRHIPALHIRSFHFTLFLSCGRPPPMSSLDKSHMMRNCRVFSTSDKAVPTA